MRPQLAYCSFSALSATRRCGQWTFVSNTGELGHRLLFAYLPFYLKIDLDDRKCRFLAYSFLQFCAEQWEELIFLLLVKWEGFSSSSHEINFILNAKSNNDKRIKELILFIYIYVFDGIFSNDDFNISICNRQAFVIPSNLPILIIDSVMIDR